MSTNDIVNEAYTSEVEYGSRFLRIIDVLNNSKRSDLLAAGVKGSEIDSLLNITRGLYVKSLELENIFKDHAEKGEYVQGWLAGREKEITDATSEYYRLLADYNNKYNGGVGAKIKKAKIKKASVLSGVELSVLFAPVERGTKYPLVFEAIVKSGEGAFSKEDIDSAQRIHALTKRSMNFINFSQGISGIRGNIAVLENSKSNTKEKVLAYGELIKELSTPTTSTLSTGQKIVIQDTKEKIESALNRHHVEMGKLMGKIDVAIKEPDNVKGLKKIESTLKAKGQIHISELSKFRDIVANHNQYSKQIIDKRNKSESQNTNPTVYKQQLQSRARKLLTAQSSVGLENNAITRKAVAMFEVVNNKKLREKGLFKKVSSFGNAKNYKTPIGMKDTKPRLK